METVALARDVALLGELTSLTGYIYAYHTPLLFYQGCDTESDDYSSIMVSIVCLVPHVIFTRGYHPVILY